MASKTRTFVYDSLSRLYSATNPESGTTLYRYDANGNLIGKADARTVVTTITVDPLNRVLSAQANPHGHARLHNIRASANIGDAPIVISVMTVAELAHGIYRAKTPERRERRRQFVDELKTHIPVHPITEATAEIIARVGGEQAANSST